MLYIMLMFAVVGSTLHALLGWALASNPLLPMPSEMFKCAVGLSGELCHSISQGAVMHASRD